MNVKRNPITRKWDFCFDAGRNPITGKRRQIRRRGFVTRKEAKNALILLKAEVLTNNFLNLSTMTYEQYMAEYSKEREYTLQRSTFISHNIYYKNVIHPRLGSLSIQKITPLIIQNFINTLVGQQKYSPRTIHLIFRIVFSSFKKARVMRIIKENPCEGISLPRPQKTEMNIWSLDQVNYFLQEAPKTPRLTRCHIGFQLGLLTGLRQGEILGLRWKDINFETHTLYIRQVVTQEAKVRTGAKNDASIRSLTIPERLVDELKMHRRQIEWEKPRCRTGYRDHDLVLPTRDGSPMIPRNFRKEFYNLTDHLELPKIRFHDTRHTHATLLLEQNVNVKLISERLGHADIQTTLNTYAHVLPNMQKTVSDKLDEILDF